MTNVERCRSLGLPFLAVLWLCSLPALAQYSSNIQGVVSDPAGAAINGASVQLVNVDTGVTALITTAESGNYRFSSLPAGNYVVTAEAKGFKKAESRFTLTTSETKGINLALPLAGTQQMVTVEVTPPTVDTDDSRQETTLSSGTVRDLPEANRNLWDILNPEMFQADGSVLKNNRIPWIGEQGDLQLRFDFINVLNHGNLGPVDADIADGSFGHSTTSLPARALQFGLRVSF
jgi:Carboxypeptidase regulatory-like domain